MLVEYAKDDTRQDYVRVTGALAVVTIFLTRIPIASLENLNHRPKLALFVDWAAS
jgi:hypothetical protein